MKGRRGRPWVYSWATIGVIARAIENGASKKQACAEAGVAYSSFMRWQACKKSLRARMEEATQIDAALGKNFGMHASRPQYQIAGDSTGSQRPEAELRTAASTKAKPFTPSSTVGNARSTWSGDLRHTLATTALAMSE
jgi:hypothetical protein